MIEIGQRYTLKNDMHDRWNISDKFRKGMAGTVTEITEEYIALKLDDHLEDLNEWDNCLHWYENECYIDCGIGKWNISKFELFLDNCDPIGFEIDRTLYSHEEMDKKLKEIGFNIWNTGGGCLAYGKELPDKRHWLITIHNDASEPTHLLDMVACGFYNAEGDDWIEIHKEYEKDNEEGCLLSELLKEHDFS